MLAHVLEPLPNLGHLLRAQHNRAQHDRVRVGLPLGSARIVVRHKVEQRLAVVHHGLLEGVPAHDGRAGVDGHGRG